MSPGAALALLLLRAVDGGPTPVSATPQVPQPIRQVAFASLFDPRVAQPLAGGLRFADLDGDGLEEAVIPLVHAGATEVARVAVYGFDQNGLLRPLLLHEGHQPEIELSPGHLTFREPIRVQGDPPCCPSRVAIQPYAWNGKALVPGPKRVELKEAPRP